jgi:hypothetical protein
MVSRLLRQFALLAAIAAWVPACSGGAPPSAVAPGAPAAIDAEGPNANAARYGSHGVSSTPPAEPTANSQPPTGTAPPLDAAHLDMAGHPCACGGECHCGHCAGMIAGCHCKPKRADGK